jgi:hypothetical protein
MNRNGRSVALSSLTPNRYSLPSERCSQPHQRQNPTIVCGDCDTHCQVRHGLIEVHRPGGIRCSGSGTTVVFDVAPVQWEQALYFATIATDRRHGNRVKIKPEPAPVAPLHRIAVTR